jgi:hypothetical protein
VLGGFEQWQRVVGGILQTAGVTGFCDNLTELDAADDDRDEVRQVLQALSAYDEPKTAAEILEDGTLRKLWPDAVSANQMGRRLRQLKDKRAAGMVLRFVKRRVANAWLVESTKS